MTHSHRNKLGGNQCILYPTTTLPKFGARLREYESKSIEKLKP